MTEFKTAVLKILSKIQENTDWEFNALIKEINEQNKYFSKETETLKKNQIEILEMKNSIKEIRNKLESIENRAYQRKERISDIEDRNLE